MFKGIFFCKTTPIPQNRNASVIESLKEKTDLMRHTHENVPNTSSYFKDLAQCYIDNNMYPVPFFFKGQK